MIPKSNSADVTYLMSDMHLHDSRPELTKLFVSFLRGGARIAAAVYLLGDIFEAWVGDDDDGALPALIAREIRDVVDAGVAVYFIHGNRDFLLGHDYAAVAGMQLLPDPFRVTLGGVPTLLTHGDRYCLADKQYQAFRKQSRDPAWQAAILGQPLAARRALAKSLRTESMMKQEAQASAGVPFSDVDDAMVAAEMATHGVNRLIHGHTHSPATHGLQLPDGRKGERIVLSDWHSATGEVVSVDASGAVDRHKLGVQWTL